MSALLEDQPLERLWFNRTREYAANKRGEEYIVSATPSQSRLP